MPLGSTRPFNRNEYQESSWGGKERPARKADNLTAICESIVYTIWEPRRLTTLWASEACYKDTFFYSSLGPVAQTAATSLFNLRIILRSCQCQGYIASNNKMTSQW
jgi:hypothetical protein